ncbi:hypothetical protein [Paenibacillus anseongense]|uniref:hypothetical protein n=1 Tax=Paenibacillus anseongense TaxID=2682845 RepID=UPI002DBD8118|nr:hypothetical protein [Paenibacillus anseongense]MEC0268116.1 hypothetical protein [Paenibacillus anseongense]
MNLSSNQGEELLTELWANVYNLPQNLDVIDRLCTDDFILSNSDGDIVVALPLRSGHGHSLRRSATSS